MRLWISAALLSAFCLPAFCQAPTPAPTRSLSFFSAVDFYGNGKIDDRENDRLSREGNALTAAGNNTSGDVNTGAGGYGVRVGVRCARHRNMDAGFSLGYVRAPKIETTLTTSAGSESRKTEATYLRAIFEAGVKAPIYKALWVRFSAGAGLARAREDVSAGGVVLLPGTGASSKEARTGLTWEASPALMLALPKGAIELGLRYTQLPTIGSTANAERLEWHPVSVYLGFSI